MKLDIQLFAASKSTTFSEPALTDAMISGNYSTLKITIKFSANNNVTYFNGKKLYCTCNGVTKSAKVSLSKGGSVTKEFTFTNIEHNVEPKSVDWAWAIDTGTSVLGYLEDDGTRRLQQIKRLGVFSGDKVTGNSILSSSSTTLTLHYDIYNLDYTYKYVYSTPNNGVYTGNLTPTGLTDNTKELSFDYNIFRYNPTANDLDISFWIETYNGDILLGSDKTTFNVTLNSGILPTVIIDDITEANTTMQNLNWGIFVKNKSQLKIEAYLLPTIGSSLTSKTIEVDNKTYNFTTIYTPMEECTTNILTTAGTNTITATAIDARQRTKTTTETINVVNYENPSITTFEVQRCLSDGTIDKNGTYLIYTAVGSISPVENNNASTFRLGYKVQGTDNYTYVTLGSSYTLNITNQISSFTISSSDIYDVVLEAIDTFTTTTITRTIDVGFDLLNFNASGKAMAIGKVSTASANEELLEIDLKTILDNDLEVTGEINQVGDLTTLITTDKTDIVSAINEVSNKVTELKPYTLYYDDTEKGTAGTITLSDNVSKYKQIEIYYNWEEDYGYTSMKLDNPNGKLATILCTYDNGTYYYSETARYSISGTSLSRSNSARWRFRTDGNPTRTNTTSSGGSIRIYKVVGYK